MSLFEGGPWDNKAKTAGAHIFSEQRKLLYGAEHDSAEHLGDGQDKSSYGKVEKHKMHDFWLHNTLKQLAEVVRRAAKDPTVKKVAGRKGPEWPGDMGKNHAIVEDLLRMDVVTLHQNDGAEVFARVHAAALHRAIANSAAAATSAASAVVSAASPSSGTPPPPAFVAAAGFTGARAGCVFKNGAQGLGYYRDDGARGSHAPSGGLPDGWTSGQTAEGYTYYWHDATGTSSWEVPTGQPSISRALVVPPQVITALTVADGGAAIRKIEDESSATITFHGSPKVAHVRGSSAAVDRAYRLLERKVGGIEFASRTLQNQSASLPPSAAPAVGSKRTAAQAGTAPASEYDFRSVAAFVADADASRAALSQQSREDGKGGGGALAALAQLYDDSDEDEADT
jgi:hypothetical protein